jgi:hypothetical protein
VKRPTREHDPDAFTSGAWVATLLFVLLLLGGLALAVYTFAKPFLPVGLRW